MQTFQFKFQFDWLYCICPETLHDSGFSEGPSHIPWHPWRTEEEGNLWSGETQHTPTYITLSPPLSVCVFLMIAIIIIYVYVQVLKEYLDNVQLGHILEREGSWDSVQDWMDILSGGEKQRMAVSTHSLPTVNRPYWKKNRLNNDTRLVYYFTFLWPFNKNKWLVLWNCVSNLYHVSTFHLKIIILVLADDDIVDVFMYLHRWPDCFTTSPSLPFWTSAPVQWVWM